MSSQEYKLHQCDNLISLLSLFVFLLTFSHCFGLLGIIGFNSTILNSHFSTYLSFKYVFSAEVKQTLNYFVCIYYAFKLECLIVLIF